MQTVFLSLYIVTFSSLPFVLSSPGTTTIVTTICNRIYTLCPDMDLTRCRLRYGKRQEYSHLNYYYPMGPAITEDGHGRAVSVTLHHWSLLNSTLYCVSEYTSVTLVIF